MRNSILVLSLSSLNIACSTGSDEGRERAQNTNPAFEEVIHLAEAPPATESPGSLETPQAAVTAAADAATSIDSAQDAQETPGYIIRVRSGENLVVLADWAGTSPTELALLNGMDVQDTLFAGQKLGFDLEGEAIDHFEEVRQDVLEARLERFIESRGGLYTVDAHAMRSGETVWGVAQASGKLPMWVVGAFNEDLNLDRLGIGDTITLPVLVDSIQASAEVEEEVVPAEQEGSSL